MPPVFIYASSAGKLTRIKQICFKKYLIIKHYIVNYSSILKISNFIED